MYVIVAVYFAYFESFMCIKTPVGHVMYLKRLITAAFGGCERFRNVRAGWACRPSLHRESTDSLITCVFPNLSCSFMQSF